MEREWNEQSYGSVDNNSQRYLVGDKGAGHTNRSAAWTAFSSGNKESSNHHHEAAASDDEEQVRSDEKFDSLYDASVHLG